MVVFPIKIEIQLSVNVGSTAIRWEGRAGERGIAGGEAFLCRSEYL